MKKQLLLLALLVASTSFAGIYRGDVSPEKYRKLATQKQFDCVGMVLDKYAVKQIGSCVLIGNKYVLSAAHLFIKSDIRQDTFFINKENKATKTLEEGGSRVIAFDPVNMRPDEISEFVFRFNRHLYSGQRLTIYPAYLKRLTSGLDFDGDVALIELSDSVSDIAPARLNSSPDELHAVFTGVGYGQSGAADKPDEMGVYMEKIAGQNTIDKISGFEVDGQPVIMSSDFDHPTRKDCNKMGSPKPLPLEYIAGGGDSGGGIFRQTGNEWLLIGIAGGGPEAGTNIFQLKKSGYYGQIMQSTRVSPFIPWIHETLNEFEQADRAVR